ncbi:MAG: DNA-protecting protein DprA, partial [Burkholderiales bacterium]|nr:DNA-protecting protein DprA [Burkholderiales bacterium]
MAVQIDTDTVDWIELSAIPELGSAAFLALLRAFGSPGEILQAGRRRLAQVVPEALAERIHEREARTRAEQALPWLEIQGHHLLTLADAQYPRGLLQIADPPPVLYLRGDPALLERPALCVVGSRNATPQGRENARAFARALAQAGFTIVSGLALGIDAAAHGGALEGAGSTVAVLGTGADLVYPRAN